MGAKTIKVVILKDGEVAGKSIVIGGLDQKKSAEEAMEKAQADAGIARDQIERIVATGAGRGEVDFADSDITEVGADAKGAIKLFPSARTVIDVGAEEGRGIRIDASGKVVPKLTTVAPIITFGTLHLVDKVTASSTKISAPLLSINNIAATIKNNAKVPMFTRFSCMYCSTQTSPLVSLIFK